ncbi:MAG: transposase [Syntrophorhabdus aromaticivorans]|uniref:Transposase n=1 Tax=Syntrophorhabdus aromaticivorans TaxID=328301 RepID=A0A971RZS9_9BACT|nr:transposase [Syntrophorhabdus aromaticivorans]
MNKRNHYSPEYKAVVVLEILSEACTVNEIAAKHGISPVVITRRKKKFLEKAPEVFKKVTSGTERELEASNQRGGKAELFRLQTPRRLQEEYLAYNTTSISSYSRTLKQVRYGRNKENDYLPQMELALVFGAMIFSNMLTFSIKSLTNSSS